MGGFLYYITNNMTILFPIELHEIINVEIDLNYELFKIFILSFTISIFTILGVLLKYKINDE